MRCGRRAPPSSGGCDDADFARTGHHVEHDTYSVQLWLEIYADHAHAHADQIRRARRGEP